MVTKNSEKIFYLGDQKAYDFWKSEKLDNLPKKMIDELVEISDPVNLSKEEINDVKELCRRANMAFYQFKKNVTKNDILKFSRGLGFGKVDPTLYGEDTGISVVTHIVGGSQKAYVPYTRKALGWHTDGYYNPLGREIGSFILHCQNAAISGGETALLDPEIVYIHLREENPKYIEALMQPDVFMVEANTKKGTTIRDSHTGPIFYVLRGNLRMRFSARKKYVKWKSDPMVSSAVECLNGFLNDNASSIVHHTLLPGQGVICNNILHKRSAYKDEATHPRVFYRLRFNQRMSN